MPALAFDFNERGDLAPLVPMVSRAPRWIATATSAPHHPAPLPAPLAQPPRPSDLKLDRTRDYLLTGFGKATLSDRYLLSGESFQDMFARVACAFADDVAHAQRLYDAMSRLWFMPATPVLSNGGADRRPRRRDRMSAYLKFRVRGHWRVSPRAKRPGQGVAQRNRTGSRLILRA